MVSMIGLGLALAIAAIAWRRGRAPGGFYDAQVYGMTPDTHRRYAWTSLGFALAFALMLGFQIFAVDTLVLAAYTVVAIVYVTSFLRGASDER